MGASICSSPKGNENVASYADALWARHAIFPPTPPLPQTSAEANGTFLSLCSKRSTGELACMAGVEGKGKGKKPTSECEG